MYEFQHLDPVILRLIDERVLTPTREEYAAKLAVLSPGELELAVKRANADGPRITDVALSLFWDLA